MKEVIEMSDAAAELQSGASESDEINQTRKEIDQARAEIDQVREEIDQVRAEIGRLRNEIDRTDTELVRLIARRWRLSSRIVELRTSAGGAVTDVGRESAIMERVTELARQEGVPVSLAADIYLVWFNAVRDTLARDRKGPASPSAG